MRSWKFPDMFTGSTSSAIWKEQEQGKATRQNAKLLLNTERNSTLGDPYIGLSGLLFEQNSSVFRDMAADNIYTQVALFLPQLHVKRDGIKLIPTSEKGKVICTITGINQTDFKVETYNLTLFDSKEESNF